MSTVFSKKIALAVSTIGLLQTLPMNADWKGICTAAVACFFLVAQAAVDIFAAKETPPPAEAKKETP